MTVLRTGSAMQQGPHMLVQPDLHEPGCQVAVGDLQQHGGGVPVLHSPVRCLHTQNPGAAPAQALHPTVDTGHVQRKRGVKLPAFSFT